MPVPTSNQGAESKRWLVPLLARSSTLSRTRSLLSGAKRSSGATLPKPQCTPHAPRPATGTAVALIPIGEKARKRGICSTFLQWSQPGSNRRPPACKAGALPTELWPRRAPSLTGGIGPSGNHAPSGGIRPSGDHPPSDGIAPSGNHAPSDGIAPSGDRATGPRRRIEGHPQVMIGVCPIVCTSRTPMRPMR
jgi:hypothetical protein